MKVVINTCYGGFSLSPQALLWLLEREYNDPNFKVPVEKYYCRSDAVYLQNDLKEWEVYLSSSMKVAPVGTKVFTPDNKFVLRGSIERENPLLVECVETLNKKADGKYAKLKVVEIPDGIEYTIEEYDGNEHVAEKHRTWK